MSRLFRSVPLLLAVLLDRAHVAAERRRLHDPGEQCHQGDGGCDDHDLDHRYPGAADAIGGVVNFITRDNFTGFEVGGQYKYVDGSDGDYGISMLGGIGEGESDTADVGDLVGEAQQCSPRAVLLDAPSGPATTR